MSEGEHFTVDSAREAAERDELSDWVVRFLASEGSDNAPLAHALTNPPRTWIGPVRLRLDHRVIGRTGEAVELVEPQPHRADPGAGRVGEAVGQLGVVAPGAGEERLHPVAELVALGGSAGGVDGEVLSLAHPAPITPRPSARGGGRSR